MDFLTPHQTLLSVFGNGGNPLVLAWWLLESIPLGAGLSSALLLSVGFVSSAIIDRFFGEDDGDSDPLMNGDSLDGDGMGGGLDDFDDMGGMDEWDDPFDDGGEEGGDSTDELDHRLSELEDEVARLSSTVNTVRSENTEISNTVDDIGENVRKLLDIYEMVTRGINPFVDEVQADGGGFESGSLGLFDDSDDDSGDEELDDSIASADAEGFFDEDLLDGDEPAGDGEFDDDLLGDELVDVGVTEEMETETTDDSGGKSFSELKDEYESGAADWADDDLEDDGETEGELADDENGLDEPEPVETDEMLFEADEGAMLAAGGASLAAGGGDGVQSTEALAESDSDATGGFQFGTTNGNDAETGEGDAPKPYLTSLPDAYVGDLLVMEWMEFLVENADVADAARAVRYYERIDWVSSDVARTLEEFLVGFGDVNVAETERPGTAELSLSHHVHSLEYVQALSESVAGGYHLGWRQFDRGEDGI